MSTVNVTHVKGCVEDLEIGEGTVVQQRNGQPVTLTKLGAASIPWSEDPVTGELVSIRTRVEGLESNLVTAANTATTQAGIATGAANTATTQAGIATGAANTATTQAGIATGAANTATTQAGIATGAANTATTQAGIATGAADTATTQAGIATGAAGTATTQATAADASATLASDWAQKTTGEVVIGQGYSAKYWAQEAASIVTAGVIDDGITSTIKTWSSSKIDTAKQNTLVSGSNVKTINGESVLGSGNISVQPTLVSGTNIKTINGTSVLGSGNITTPTTTVNNTLTSTSTTEALSAAQGKVLQDSKQATLVSGTNIKTVNGTSLLGSGDLPIAGGTGLTTLNLTGNYTMANTIERAINIASSTGEYNITLPAANNLGSKGVMFFIRNNTNYKFPVYNGNNEFIFYLAENTTCFLSCVDTSTVSGKWIFEQENISESATTVLNSVNEYYDASQNDTVVLQVDTNAWCIIYYSSITGAITAQVVTVSNLTITVGAVTGINMNSGAIISADVLDTNKVIVSQGGGSQYDLRVLTISGTSITAGTSVADGATSLSSCTVIAMSPTVALLAYNNGGSAFYRTVSVSGTTLTLNAATSLGTTNTLNQIVKLSSTRALFMFQYSSSEYRLSILTVSGSTVSAGTAYIKSGFQAASGGVPYAIKLIAINESLAVLVRSLIGSNAGYDAGLHVLSIDCSGSVPEFKSSFEDRSINSPAATNSYPHIACSVVSGKLIVDLSLFFTKKVYLFDVSKKGVALDGQFSVSDDALYTNTFPKLFFTKYRNSCLVVKKVTVSGIARIAASIMTLPKGIS